MADYLLFPMTLIAALGCGLIAGVFFAFSTFVMKALFSLPPAEGIAAMQSINVSVLNRWFMGAFFGTGVACLLLTLLVLPTNHGTSIVLVVLASALYLIGTLGVTIVCNVPRNQALAKLDPHAMNAPARWNDYAVSWTRWNHVRSVAALAAAALFSVALGV